MQSGGEPKKEEFQRYLEKSGVIDAMTKGEERATNSARGGWLLPLLLRHCSLHFCPTLIVVRCLFAL